MNEQDLRTAIFDKYYGEAERRGLFWTSEDWAKTQVKRENFETDYEHESACEDFVEKFEHIEAIKKLLAYEISIFVYRHLNGPWGEILDFFKYERNSFCNQYREKTGYQLIGNDMEKIFE